MTGGALRLVARAGVARPRLGGTSLTGGPSSSSSFSLAGGRFLAGLGCAVFGFVDCDAPFMVGLFFAGSHASARVGSAQVTDRYTVSAVCGQARSLLHAANAPSLSLSSSTEKASSLSDMSCSLSDMSCSQFLFVTRVTVVSVHFLRGWWHQQRALR